MRTISALFDEQVKKNPHQIAVMEEEYTLSYQQLDEKSNQLAHYLINLGVREETPVALCMQRSVSMLVAILGILKAGGAYVPLDPESPHERLFLTLNDCRSPIVITQKHYKKNFIRYKGELLLLDQYHNKFIQTFSKKPVSHKVNPSNLAYVIYTSGSTGQPKGVMIEHQSVANYALWFATIYTSTTTEIIDFSSNYIFDLSISVSLVPMMLGLTVVICRDNIKNNPHHYLQYLNDYRINLIKMTPSYFRVLIHEMARRSIDLPFLESIILGGESLHWKDCHAWLNRYPEHTLYNEYGPTEATVAISQFKIQSHHVQSSQGGVPIGLPGPDMHCCILDEHHQAVANGEIGELLIGGICLARGYLNQPELSQTKFLDIAPYGRLYKSGDLCRIDKDGLIEYLGRIDTQIKIRGFRIEPIEIEHCLINYPHIREALVTTKKSFPNQLIAYYVPDTYPLHLTSQKLRHYLRKHLPEYMIPSAYIEVKAFPLTPNGKLDIDALPLPPMRLIKQRMSLTPLEAALKVIWTQELGLKSIGKHDNFFELGGHSLAAARIISEINYHYSTALSVEVFYKHPTLSKLAALLDETPSENIQLKKLLITPSKHFPLSDFQFMLRLADQFEPKARKLNVVARRRIKGELNKDALNFAIQAIYKKHAMLNSRQSFFRPTQTFSTTSSSMFEEKDLERHSVASSKKQLQQSFVELLNYHCPTKSLCMIRLFRLKDAMTELQICMSHIISDNVSPDILFADLSKFYMEYTPDIKLDHLPTDTVFRDYLLEEQLYFRDNFERDRIFWKYYLKDANLFSFPLESVVSHPSSTFSYSTYCQIPEESVLNLKHFCASLKISIQDGLCAVLGKALTEVVGFESQRNILFNRVKSTRNETRFDETIGCFLSLDPIRVNLNKSYSLTELAQHIHQSTLETLPYQRCSSLLKLASIDALCLKKQSFQAAFRKILASVYSRIFSTSSFNRKIFKSCTQLKPLTIKNLFMVNVNVFNQFLENSEHLQSDLFGLKKENIEFQPYDLLKIDQFLDFCFVKEGHHPYVVISSNLKTEVREKLAREILRLLDSETLQSESSLSVIEQMKDYLSGIKTGFDYIIGTKTR